MSVPLFDAGVPLFQAEGVDPGAVKLDTAAPAAPSLSGPTVNVTDGKQTYSLPTSQLALAATRGFREETAPERAIREYLRENEGIGGTGKVLLRSAVDQLGFGLGGAILGGTLDADPLEKAKHDALAKQHAAASYAGAAAGFVADLFATKGVGALKFVTAGGELARGAVLGERGAVALGAAVTANMLAEGATRAAAKSAGAGFARKLAASAAQMGTEGLLISAPKAVTEAALGDPAKAAETILAGVAGGALLGAGGSALGAGLGQLSVGVGKLAAPATRAIEESGGLRNWVSKKAQGELEEQTLRQFWARKEFSKELAQVKGGRKTVLDVIERNGLEGLKPGEAWEDAAKRLSEQQNKIGAQIGEAVSEFGPEYYVHTRKVAEALRSEVLEPIIKKANNIPTFEPLVTMATEQIKRIEGEGEKTLGALFQLRKDLDESIRWKGTPQVLGWNEVAKEIRGKLDKEIMDRFDRMGVWDGEANAIGAKIRRLKQDYQVTTILTNAAEDNIARGNANNQTGVTGMVGALAGSTIGGVAGGFLGMAAANHWKQYGSRYTIDAIGALQKRGILLTEQAMGAAARQLDRVPSIVERLAGPAAAQSVTRLRVAAAPIAETTPTRVFAEYLGHSAGTPSEQAAAVAQKIASVTSDPQRLKDHVDALAKDYADDAPNVASALRAQSTAAVRYLQSVAPPPPPFSPLGGKQKVAYSDAQLRSFARKLEAVHDPWTVLARLENGTLTKDHVEALRTVYPSLYQEVVQRSIAHATQQSTMPYAAQLRLQQLTGAPLVPSVQRVSAFQASYSGGGGQRVSHGKPFAAPKPSTIARISG